jgi:hypothetical protein
MNDHGEYQDPGNEFDASFVWIGDGELERLEWAAMEGMSPGEAEQFRKARDFLGAVTVDEARWLLGAPDAEGPGWLR